MISLDQLTVSVLTHKGDVLVVTTKPITKLGLSADEAEAFAAAITAAVKQAREELENAPDPGRKPS